MIGDIRICSSAEERFDGVSFSTGVEHGSEERRVAELVLRVDGGAGVEEGLWLRLSSTLGRRSGAA